MQLTLGWLSLSFNKEADLFAFKDISTAPTIQIICKNMIIKLDHGRSQVDQDRAMGFCVLCGLAKQVEQFQAMIFL